MLLASCLIYSQP